MASRNIASIDIGTNTTRLLIAKTGNGSLTRLYREQKITRLGENIAANGGFITPEAISRTAEAVRGFLRNCKEHDVTQIKAVATSAARSSVNGKELVSRIKSETGITPEIISGEREAYLTILGILGMTGKEDADCYILDIGGGSTEFSVVTGGVIKHIKSLEIGVLHLSREFNISEIPEDAELDRLDNEIKTRISAYIGDIKNKYGIADPELIATSGTPLTLACISAGLEKYDTEKIEGYELTQEDVKRLLGEIKRYTPEQRLKRYRALEPGREEIIIPGCLILLNVMESIGMERVTVTESSLLEGIMLDD